MTDKQADRFALLMAAAVFAHNFARGYDIRGHSLMYLSDSLSILRPPIYPLFLDLMRHIFGAQGLAMAALIQTMLAIWAVLFLARAIRKHFAITPIGFLFLLGVLFAPLLPVTTIHIDDPHLSTNILSESLAYPFMLFAAGFMVKAIAAPNAATIMPAMLFSLAGVLTRAQLIFLWPVTVCWLAALWFAKILPLKRAAAFCAVAVLLAISGSGINRLYHEVENGMFTSPPLGSWGLLTSLLYVSTPQDIAALPETGDKPTLEAIYARAQSLKALEYQRTYPLVEHFNGNYDNITWSSSHAVYNEINRANYARGPEGDARLIYDLNKFSGRTAKMLLARKWKDYARLLAAKTYQAFGWLDLLILAMFASGVVYRRNRDAGILLAMAASIVFFNICVLLPLNVVYGRYTLYNDVFNLAVIVTLASITPRDATRANN